jgi:hypothetical protein
MSTATASRVVSLHVQDALELAIDRDTIFSNHKSLYKKGVEKRQTKLLKKIPFLKKFLQKDEEIGLVTMGCSPTSLLEQLFTGWIFVYLKRAMFVFTNKRIFHVPTTANYGYRNSIAQILYTDCSSIKMRGRMLVVQYKNGKKEKFLYMAGRERKKIKALLSTLSFEGAPSKTQQRTHLCPRCTRELEEMKYTCSNCRLEFKSKEEAKRISLIYPGGGYFYTGHPFLGISDAITEAILLFLVFAGLTSMIQGAKGGTAALVIFGIALAIEKTITVYHSNHFIKEYITKEKEIKSVAYKD